MPITAKTKEGKIHQQAKHLMGKQGLSAHDAHGVATGIVTDHGPRKKHMKHGKKAKKKSKKIAMATKSLAGELVPIVDADKKHIWVWLKGELITKLTHSEIKQYADDLTHPTEATLIMGKINPHTYKGLSDILPADWTPDEGAPESWEMIKKAPPLEKVIHSPLGETAGQFRKAVPSVSLSAVAPAPISADHRLVCSWARP